jgi:lysophospholipase L1-like esterase
MGASRSTEPRPRGSAASLVLLLVSGSLSFAACAGAPHAARIGLPPSVRTLPPSAVTTDAATLNGAVDPHGTRADAWFEIGTGPSLSKAAATPVQVQEAATSFSKYRRAVRGLTPYATYYYRAAARNGFGIGRGDILEFPAGEYWIAIGDSITAGAPGVNFESRLGELLTAAKGHPVVVANLGLPGATAAAGAEKIAFALSTFPWARYYLILFGSNDAFLPRPVPSGKGTREGEPGYAGSYKESLRKVIVGLRAEGKVPCLAKVPFAVLPSVDATRIREYNDVIDELVSEEHLPFPAPDFFSYFQAHPSELSDGLHPNRAGYDAMAELWLGVLTGIRPH